MDWGAVARRTGINPKRNVCRSVRVEIKPFSYLMYLCMRDLRRINKAKSNQISSAQRPCCERSFSFRYCSSVSLRSIRTGRRSTRRACSLSNDRALEDSYDI